MSTTTPAFHPLRRHACKTPFLKWLMIGQKYSQRYNSAEPEYKAEKRWKHLIIYQMTLFTIFLKVVSLQSMNTTPVLHTSKTSVSTYMDWLYDLRESEEGGCFSQLLSSKTIYPSWWKSGLLMFQSKGQIIQLLSGFPEVQKTHLLRTQSPLKAWRSKLAVSVLETDHKKFLGIFY